MYKTLATVLALTPALAIGSLLVPKAAAAGTVETFPSSEYAAVVRQVEAGLGWADTEIRFRDCSASLCDNRTAYWWDGEMFVRVGKHVWNGRGEIFVDSVCPTAWQAVCKRIEAKFD